VAEVVGLETALDLEHYMPYYKKMEQMTELLKAMQERMETQIGSLASKMNANQAKTDVNQVKTNPTLKEIRASEVHLQEKMLAKWKPR
jgi:hypothetical protein